MKILHTSDWHVGRTMRGRSRHDEHVAVLAEMVEVAAAEQVDAIVIAGDQFDFANPGPEAETLVYRTLMDLAEIAPVVMVAGNHDHPRRLAAVAPLLRLGRITVGAVVSRPEEGGVVRPVDGLRVALIPFLSQRSIVTAADLMSLAPDAHGGKYADRVAGIADVLCAGATADEVNLLVGHLMVHGASPSGDEREAHTVMDYSVSAHAFPAGLSYVALGHLHRHQRVPAPAPVYYAGSPLQLDFGEVEQAKGVVVVEASPGLPARVQFRPLRSGRRLRVLRGSLAEVEALAADVADDDYVKVVLDEATRPGLADAARRLVPQAVDVIIDPARRPQQAPRRVRAGRSHRELFVEYLRERDAFDERVVALFDELAEEAHEA